VLQAVDFHDTQFGFFVIARHVGGMGAVKAQLVLNVADIFIQA
jgi:hypothetical protein